jgi:hypothetical protein
MYIGMMTMKIVDGVATKALYKIMTAKDMEQVSIKNSEFGRTINYDFLLYIIRINTYIFIDICTYT